MQRLGVSDGRRGGVAAGGVLAALGIVPLQAVGAPTIIGLVLLLLAIVVVSSAVEIVDAYEKRALTVFGEFRGLLEPGINYVPPFVSNTTVFDMRTETLDVPKQEAITRDNSPVVANAVVYIRVMDAKKAFLEVEDYRRAVSNLAQTTLRAVLGDMELDDTLNKRREINERIREELAEPTDEWGVRVESVEVQEITPSKDVLQSMEQQTSAERRRRAMILEAQGERRAAIESAQGDKQSNIIRAQGEKQSQILEAQGDAISTVLRAKSAESMGERAIIEKGMETLGAIGEDESTTYVLPQELTSLVGRYGKHLTGSDVADGDGGIESLDFDEDTREMLGLDDIEEILGEIEHVELDGDGSAPGDDPAGAADEIAGTADELAGTTEDIPGGNTADVGDDRMADADARAGAGQGSGRRQGGSGDRGASGAAADPIPDPEEVASTVEETTERAQSAVEDVTPDVDDPDEETDPGEDPEADPIAEHEKIDEAEAIDDPEEIRESEEVLDDAENETFEWETPEEGEPPADAPDRQEETDEETDTERSG